MAFLREEGMTRLVTFLQDFAVIFIALCVIVCARFFLMTREKRSFRVAVAIMGLLSIGIFVYLWFVLGWVPW